MLFEHGFYLTKPIWAPIICLNGVTQESVASLTDHFAEAFVREKLPASMTLLRGYDVRKFEADAILF